MERAIVWCVAALGAALVIWLGRLRTRWLRARRAEGLAVERRDRFLGEVAGELDAPLAALRGELISLTPRAATPERVGAIVRGLDDTRALVAELANLPRRPKVGPLAEIDLAEVVREIVAAPPFSDRGPTVIMRARPAPVLGERARLVAGLRVLLWVVRREVAERGSLAITVSADDEHALVEIDAPGGAQLVATLEHEPAFGYGLRDAEGPPGATLALRVAAEVARAHGGRLSASSRAGHEHFVLELPSAAPPGG